MVELRRTKEQFGCGKAVKLYVCLYWHKYLKLSRRPRGKTRPSAATLLSRRKSQQVGLCQLSWEQMFHCRNPGKGRSDWTWQKVQGRKNSWLGDRQLWDAYFSKHQPNLNPVSFCWFLSDSCYRVEKGNSVLQGRLHVGLDRIAAAF